MKVERALCVLMLASALIFEVHLAWLASFHPNGQFRGVEWPIFAVLAIALAVPLVA